MLPRTLPHPGPFQPLKRVAERSVHAHAAGAFSEIKVAYDVSQCISAAFFAAVGKKPRVLLRLSTVGRGVGSANTLRDIRGRRMKAFTESNPDFVSDSSVR